jgi:hypothetical protein
MSHFSITVPADDAGAIRAAAEFFADRCGCLVEPKPRKLDYIEPTEQMTAIINNHAKSKIVDVTNIGIHCEGQSGQELIDKALTEIEHGVAATFDSVDVATVFKEAAVNPGWKNGSQPLATPPILGMGVNLTGGVTDAIIAINPTLAGLDTTVLPPAPVTLANGIPWDERIHSSSKTTMKAAPHGWKPKKQPNTYTTKESWLAYIAEVEAELRAAVAVPAPPVTTVPIVSPTLPPPMPSIPPVMTYAGLTEAITRAGISPDAVQGALTQMGLASYPILATRPDLITQVASLLGVVRP